MDDFRRPQRPPQRPIHDLGPRPQQRAPGPITDLRPQAQQPLRQQLPQRPTHALHQVPHEAFQAPKPVAPNPPVKKKRQILKPNKVVLIAGAAALLIVGSFIFINSNNRAPSTQSKAQQITAKPFEAPQFTTYYPNYLPAGLSTTKGSIAYYKDSFTFIIDQAGQKSFFVYEKPAASDPGFNTLKSQLTTPKAISLSIGKGVEGGLDIRTITAVNTKDGTNLMVSCSKAGCGDTSKQILANMQLTNDLDSLKRNN